MASLNLSSAPAVEPATLAEAKEHCRVETGDENTYIGALITAARQWCEEYTCRSFITQTWEYRIDTWPAVIELPRGPVQSITSIGYVDTNGDSQAFTDFTEDIYNDTCRIVPAYGYTWPDIRVVNNAITVTFVAGYGDAGSDVPGPITQAIKMLTAHMFENREIVSFSPNMHSLPFAVESLLWPYRIVRFV